MIIPRVGEILGETGGEVAVQAQATTDYSTHEHASHGAAAPNTSIVIGKPVSNAITVINVLVITRRSMPGIDVHLVKPKVTCELAFGIQLARVPETERNQQVFFGCSEPEVARQVVIARRLDTGVAMANQELHNAYSASGSRRCNGSTRQPAGSATVRTPEPTQAGRQRCQAQSRMSGFGCATPLRKGARPLSDQF